MMSDNKAQRNALQPTNALFFNGEVQPTSSAKGTPLASRNGQRGAGGKNMYASPTAAQQKQTGEPKPTQMP